MTYSNLEVSEFLPGVRQITLQRPRQFNALSKALLQELHAAFDEFIHSDDRAIVITGGGRAFCFGADFEDFQDKENLPLMLQIFQDLIKKIYFAPKITIALLNGFATGAGLDLALACDFRLAVDSAKLGEAYIGMGLVSDGGGSFFLSQMTGTSRAMEMLILGESISATEAQSLGLINRAFPAGEFQEQSRAFVRSIAEKPAAAARLLKQLVKKNAAADLKTALENERDAQMICFEDPDHRKIVDEFLAKRAAKKRS